MVSAAGGIPSTVLFQSLTGNGGDKALARFREDPRIQADLNYFTETVAKLETVEEFLDDRRLMQITLTAFGLEGEMQYLGRMEKIMTEPRSESGSLVNKLIDPRFKEIAEFLKFDTQGLLNVQISNSQTQLLDRYVVNEYEESLGQQNLAMREAAYFMRNAGEISNTFQLLGDPVMRSVIQTALQLPDGFNNLSIDAQADFIDDRLDITKFAETDLTNFSQTQVDSAREDVAALASARAAADAGVAATDAVVSRLDTIIREFELLSAQTDAAGENAALIAQQSAAVADFAFGQSLLNAAKGAGDRTISTLGRMQELITLASDPANAANLADYKTEFAQVINTAITDLNNANALDPTTGTARSLVFGNETLGPIEISAGEFLTLNGTDATGLVTALNNANTAFQAVTDSTDAANLGTTSTALGTADTELTALRLAFNVEDDKYDAALAATGAYVAPVNSAELETGEGSVTDAITRVLQIRLLVTEMATLAQTSADSSFVGDRNDLQTQFDDLRTQVTDLINAGPTGYDNLLTSGTQTYEVINGTALSARGEDLTSSLSPILSIADISTEAGANAFLTDRDATVNPLLDTVNIRLRTDEAALSLAANRFNPFSDLNDQIRTFATGIDAVQASGSVDGRNLLDINSVDIFASTSNGQTFTLTPNDFGGGVADQVRSAVDQLLTNPTAALDTLRTAKTNAENIRLDIRQGLTSINVTVAPLEEIIAADEAARAENSIDPYAVNDFTSEFIQKFLTLRDAAGISTGGGATGWQLGLFGGGNSGGGSSGIVNLLV